MRPTLVSLGELEPVLRDIGFGVPPGTRLGEPLFTYYPAEVDTVIEAMLAASPIAGINVDTRGGHLSITLTRCLARDELQQLVEIMSAARASAYMEGAS